MGGVEPIMSRLSNSMSNVLQGVEAAAARLERVNTRPGVGHGIAGANQKPIASSTYPENVKNPTFGGEPGGGH